MKYRVLGKTGFNISEISLGTWQLGSKWGEKFNKEAALETLQVAYDNGVNFFDTADVYQNGLSEKIIGKFIKDKKNKIYVVTKCGRKLNPHTTEGYNRENIISFVESSIKNMDVEVLDLVLLHCPPTDVFYKKEVFYALDKLKAEGKIKHYGVSVERIEEAIKAMDYDISVVEIIFNMFRLKPSELLFKLAKENNIGIIARVPLASGLLTGKYDENTNFSKNDHRNYNRNGEFFDKGETFAGVNYPTGIKAAEELKLRLNTESLALSALRYILMYDEVSTVIPGASTSKQIQENVKASSMDAFSDKQMEIVKEVYDNYIKPTVHFLW
ncbi:aldo/keto reductase [Haloimpatiens sp. FM7315]|uniref:aldo/keto reductase n=1 Tax=Haloimpatiens sp. FM7315 TaxID=3298609 RepID=UPI0035A301AF